MVQQILLLPTDNDVLMGQSPNLRSHPGNARLKELVASRFEEYDGASKLHKTRIAEDIIRTMQIEERRFLKQPERKRINAIKDAEWVLEADPVRIRDKVASQFRGHKKEQRRHPSRPETDSHRIKRVVKRLHPFENEQPAERSFERSLPLKKRKILDHNFEHSSNSLCNNNETKNNFIEFKNSFDSAKSEHLAESVSQTSPKVVLHVRKVSDTENLVKNLILELGTDNMIFSLVPTS